MQLGALRLNRFEIFGVAKFVPHSLREEFFRGLPNRIEQALVDSGLAR
jgi:hypothetical protein